MTFPDQHASVLVIGYGNTLRRDDGLGWRAAEALAERLTPDDVQIMTCHQLTIELAEVVSRSSFVVLIDAARDDPPGAVFVRDVKPDPDAWQSLLHYMTPEALLASAQALYGTTPRAYLVTVNGLNFEVGEGLSAEVQAALPACVDRIVTLIDAR